MTDTRMPAISLAAVPGRRARTLELAAEIERKGFSGIWCPSFGDPMSLCLSMAHVTSEVELATSIEPIYFRQPHDLAAAAAFLHEVSGGRFRLGLGVSHGPVHERLGLSVGKPLSDIRDYVEALRGPGEQAGGLPPVVLAALRTKMTALAAEIADGAVWANASRSHMAASLEVVPADRRDGFIVTDMIPTVVDDDRAAAAAVNRKTLSGYVALPNYRNYWKEAGYEEEMAAVEQALAAGDTEGVQKAMTDEWLADCTLFGSVAEVREGVEAWFETGTTPILVPSSTSGGQLQAMEEVFAAFS
jgi:alkanesulfonate monooxygenase SsuD/methylene tetrahydromethanopterin reductase-like flavin-dependent oxidoreductase (luciferase family)